MKFPLYWMLCTVFLLNADIRLCGPGFTSLAMVGAMVAEKWSKFVSDTIKSRSRVHARAEVGPLIQPTKPIIQMGPVAFYPTVTKETLFGVQEFMFENEQEINLAK